MRVRNFAVSLTAAAVMGAFGPAFAQTTNVDPNAGANVSPGVNLGSGSQSVNSGVSANQQSTDVTSSYTMNQGAATGGSAPSSSTNVTPNVGVGANVGIGNSDVNAGVNVSPGSAQRPARPASVKKATAPFAATRRPAWPPAAMLQVGKGNPAGCKPAGA